MVEASEVIESILKYKGEKGIRLDEYYLNESSTWGRLTYVRPHLFRLTSDDSPFKNILLKSSNEASERLVLSARKTSKKPAIKMYIWPDWNLYPDKKNVIVLEISLVSYKMHKSKETFQLPLAAWPTTFYDYSTEVMERRDLVFHVQPDEFIQLMLEKFGPKYLKIFTNEERKTLLEKIRSLFSCISK